MTVGEGMLWSTILLLLALAAWRTTVNKKWRLVGMVIGGLVAVGGVGIASFLAWDRFKNRPRVVTELAGVALGMRPVDVTLALGEPANRLERRLAESSGAEPPFFAYRKGYDEQYVLTVYFESTKDGERVRMICERDGDSRIFGFSRRDTEREVLRKLGQPANTSIRKDGLAKLISYPQWKVVYMVEQSAIRGFCVSNSGQAQFAEEFVAEPPSSRDTTASAAPTLASKGWTQESTGSRQAGPWLKYSPPGTRYYRDAEGTIYRVFPPGVRPDAGPANRFALDDTTGHIFDAEWP